MNRPDEAIAETRLSLFIPTASLHKIPRRMPMEGDRQTHPAVLCDRLESISANT